MLEWLAQIWSRLLGVQGAVADLRAHVDARFSKVDAALDRIERVAGLPASVLPSMASIQRLIREEVIETQTQLAEVRELLTASPARLVFSIEVEGNTLKGVEQMTLKPGKRYRASVQLQPENARVDGAFSWQSSDENVLTATPEGDGRTAQVTTPADGVATLTVSVDADLGEGVRKIEAVVGVIVGLEAESLAVGFEEIGDLEPVGEPTE